MIVYLSLFFLSIPTFNLMFSLKSLNNPLKLLVINKFYRKMLFCKSCTFTTLMFCKSFI